MKVDYVPVTWWNSYRMRLDYGNHDDEPTVLNL